MASDIKKGEKKTILIIDDEQGMLNSLEALFSDNFDVLKAEDGKEGLSLLSRFRVDLVLLDLKLPGMDGVEVLKRMRALSKGVPVLVMTAYSTIERAETCADLMVQGYIRKPFDPFDLFERVRSILEKGGGIGIFKQNRSKNNSLERPHTLVRESIKMIASHYKDPIRPRDVAVRVHISRHYLGKKFKKETGQSISEYINLNIAKHSIKTDMGESIIKASWRTFKRISTHVSSPCRSSPQVRSTLSLNMST